MFSPKCYRDSKFVYPLKLFWLKTNGCWPADYDAHKRWWQQPIFVLYTIWAWMTIVNVTFNVYAEMAYLIEIFGDLSKTTENLCTNMMGLLSLIRLIHLRLYQREFRELLQKFADDIWIPKNSEPHIERACSAKLAPFDRMTFILLLCLFMYFLFPIIFIIHNGLTMASRDKPFPYQMIFPYDAQSGWRYIYTYIMAVLAGWNVITQFCGQDLLFGLFVSYTCGQFEILHQQIGHLIPECHEQCMREMMANSCGNATDDDCFVPDEGNSELKLRIQKCCTERLHELASQHNKLIEFCQLLEKFNSFPLLVNFLISTFLICMVGFQFLSGTVIFLGDYIKFPLYFLGLTGQLYVICANGNELIQYSTATAWHLYACNWEGGHISKASPLMLLSATEMSTSLRKLPSRWRNIDYYPASKNFQHKMKFMIMRSQREVHLTAMKFSILSLYTFAKLLSSSMSYFTLLRTFLEK